MSITMYRACSLLVITLCFVALLALLAGCAPVTRIPVEPNGVKHTASLQFNIPLRAFVLVPGALEREGKRWPLLIEEGVDDKAIVCFEHRTSNHTEDCTVLGNLRKFTQGRR